MKNSGEIIYFPFPHKFVKINYILLFPYLIYFLFTHRVFHTFTTQTLINSALGIFKTLGLLNKTKVIVRESNSIFELFEGQKLKRYKMAYSLGYRNVNLIICQTDYMKEGILSKLPWLNKNKVIVIPNPINLGYINELENQVIDSLADLNYIVAAGRLVPAKGFDLLIQAFSNVFPRHSNLKLIILGEGSMRRELEELIQSLNLQNKIILKGLVNNVFPYFRKAKLCVLSSRIEGFPNVLLQMMSQNENIVATRSAGDIENIPGIKTCPINDVAALTKAISEGLKNPESNRIIFDKYLNERTMDNFVDNIYSNLD
jgi:glycosyltransferase involved in cell wall biosynthesis